MIELLVELIVHLFLVMFQLLIAGIELLGTVITAAAEARCQERSRS